MWQPQNHINNEKYKSLQKNHKCVAVKKQQYAVVKEQQV